MEVVAYVKLSVRGPKNGMAMSAAKWANRLCRTILYVTDDEYGGVHVLY